MDEGWALALEVAIHSETETGSNDESCSIKDVVNLEEIAINDMISIPDDVTIPSPVPEKKEKKRRHSLLHSVSSNVINWANLGSYKSDRETSSKTGFSLKVWYERAIRSSAAKLICFPVVLPTNHIVEKWDMVMIVMLIYVATVAPYDMAFLPTKIDAIFYFNRFVDFGFFVDMILQFNLAVYGAYGRLSKDRGDIVWNYLHAWFPIDLISIVPFDTLSMMVDDSSLSNMQGLKALRLLRLAKMLRLLRANRMFSRFEARIEINYSMCQLYGYLLMLCLLIHWLACGWYMVISLEGAGECYSVTASEQECCNNWLDCYGPADAQEGRNAARKYFLSIMWSTAEVLTVSSDIFAVTDIERGYVVAVRVLSGIVYAYLIGAVCSIFTTLTKDQMAFFEDMDQLNHFLYSMNVTNSDPELCASLRMFYRYSHSHQSGSSQVKEILNVITPNLKGELAFKVHSFWLQNLSLFHGAAMSKPFYVALSLEISQRISAPMESLIEAHHPSDTLFVIERGMVLSQGRVKTIGDCFGEDCMWSTKKRGYQATSMTHGKLILIDSGVLFEILQRPQFRQESCHIRKRISFQKMKQLVILFFRLMQNGAKEPTLEAGSQLVYEELSFVKEDQLGVILDIFIRFYLRSNPECKQEVEDIPLFVEGLRSFERHMIYEMECLLSPLGLKERAGEFVEEERMDVKEMMRISPQELNILGVPMGLAIEFCHETRQKCHWFTNLEGAPSIPLNCSRTFI